MNREHIALFHATLSLNAQFPIKCHICKFESTLGKGHFAGWCYRDKLGGDKLDRFLCPACKDKEEG